MLPERPAMTRNGPLWEPADRIKMFTIAADDIIPWELLYSADGNNDNGVLAEHFPSCAAFIPGSE
jgi:hypothetical protein